MSKKEKKAVYHGALQIKSQKKISKEATQTRRREGELLKEYRSLRKQNAFIDQRKAQHAASHKRTKAEKFILDDVDTFGGAEALGVTSRDALQERTHESERCIFGFKEIDS